MANRDTGMKADDFWLDGVKARGDACKQGAVVAGLLIGAIALRNKDGVTDWIAAWSMICLTASVGCSALALWAGGQAGTDHARLMQEQPEKIESHHLYHSKGEDEPEIAYLMKHPRRLIWWAGITGSIQILTLVVGMILFLVSIVR